MELPADPALSRPTAPVIPAILPVFADHTFPNLLATSAREGFYAGWSLTARLRPTRHSCFAHQQVRFGALHRQSTSSGPCRIAGPSDARKRPACTKEFHQPGSKTTAHANEPASQHCDECCHSTLFRRHASPGALFRENHSARLNGSIEMSIDMHCREGATRRSLWFHPARRAVRHPLRNRM